MQISTGGPNTTQHQSTVGYPGLTPNYQYASNAVHINGSKYVAVNLKDIPANATIIAAPPATIRHSADLINYHRDSARLARGDNVGTS